jgi:hypothetical protein
VQLQGDDPASTTTRENVMKVCTPYCRFILIFSYHPGDHRNLQAVYDAGTGTPGVVVDLWRQVAFRDHISMLNAPQFGNRLLPGTWHMNVCS